MAVKKMCNSVIYSICVVFLFFAFLSEAKTKEDKKKMRSRKHSGEIIEVKKAPQARKLDSELTYEELKQKKDALLAYGNIESAVKIIEQMLRLCANMDIASSLLLELADLLYTNAKFDSALHTYKSFIMHYEGHQQFEYALFKAIQCSAHLLLDFDRDQAQTEEALALAEKYLSLEHCVAHRSEVEQVKNDCISRLFSSELYNVEFYAKMGKIPVAQSHLAYIKSQDVFQNVGNYTQEINRLEKMCLVEQDAQKEEKTENEAEKSYPNHHVSMYNEIF